LWRGASVDAGILLHIFGGKKCRREERSDTVAVGDGVSLRALGHVMLPSCLLASYWLV